MPLSPKDKLLQIRLEADLLQRVTDAAEMEEMSVSLFVRRALHLVSTQRLKAHASNAKWAAIEKSRAQAARASEDQKSASEAVLVPSEGPLARKRRLEAEAKKLKMARRDENR